jgi:hypothetical protein
MNIVEILKRDYQHFPLNQTYTIYDRDVYFKDPLSEFRGLDTFQKNIATIARWFSNIQMELHDIQSQEELILTEWTLYMTSPLPWRPLLVISGRSELRVNEVGLIYSHIDYWNCSIFQVILQNFNINKKRIPYPQSQR